MLTFVLWKWAPTLGYAHKFTAEHVNAQARAIRRYYDGPARIVCITDDPTGVECETFPLWTDLSEVPNPTGAGRPSCYRRLRIFDPAVSGQLGDRIAWIDLDMLIVAEITPLFRRTEPFVGLQDWYCRMTFPGHLNGSICLFDPKDKRNIALWSDFDPLRSPMEAHGAGCRGSDQGWMSFKMAPCPALGAGDGVLRYGKDFHAASEPPPHARIICFAGPKKPWYRNVAEKSPWAMRYLDGVTVVAPPPSPTAPYRWPMVWHGPEGQSAVYHYIEQVPHGWKDHKFAR